MIERIYKNKKNGNLYEIIDMDIIDSNNDRNNDRTVYYTDGIRKYTRKYDEFMKKFSSINVFTREDLEIIATKFDNDLPLTIKINKFLENNPSLVSTNKDTIFTDKELKYIRNVLIDHPISDDITSYLDMCNQNEIINSKNYVKNVINTESNNFDTIIKRISDPKVIRLLHSFMGLTTETGELMDVLKKYLFYGKPIDFINIKEELGDEMWYIGIAIDVVKSTLDDIMSGNIEKLRKRYPDKFSEHDALNRDTDKEINHIK